MSNRPSRDLRKYILLSDPNLDAFYEYQFIAAASRADERVPVCSKWTRVLLDVFRFPPTHAPHFLVPSFFVERLSRPLTATSPHNDFLGGADCRTRSSQRHMDL